MLPAPHRGPRIARRPRPAPTATAQAQGSLVLYCTVQEEWCRVMVTARARDRHQGLDDAQEPGEFYAQLKAEASNRAATSGGAAPAIRTCRRPRKG